MAFYLPQFHPIPENDEWWGKGFTEWTNVTKARPLFPGHHQPHFPADLGFYDLRLAETREAQATLARQYGIHGFCYYHYWFNGRRILERPFNDVLASGKPDFPFCLCWANENWSRAWDGGSRHLLLEQHYSEEDDRAHIVSLLPALRDPRYIRINGRPLLLIYRTELLPNPLRTAEIWREVARESGLGDLYLARVENFVSGIDPESIGFDAAVEFSPDNRDVGQAVFSGPISNKLSRWGLLPKAFSQHSVFRYSVIAEARKKRPIPSYKQFRCVTPMWDNSARRKSDGRILVGSTPKLYRAWLSAMLKQTRERFSGEERIVFINAWNEWAEGCHLEPDLKHGHAYLEATKQALAELSDEVHEHATARDQEVQISKPSSSWRHSYWRLLHKIRHVGQIVRAMVRQPIS
ncbi:glycoside hydrolase family 99-like domain-containing protein [Methylocaldum sp.]|uniref:glycosyltransferase WbsX family protein n=1 Tax=Methylocaldum sp. TaxID=1969727 RepID=UPI002D505F47|nr:glycoside hydrolase family 99-like domain-containing protein [Methylocaldum sp.]HYE37878.1 glycoside hydrolase family 99-like domain-containing protein [Methylocaldum sp.]